MLVDCSKGKIVDYIPLTKEVSVLEQLYYLSHNSRLTNDPTNNNFHQDIVRKLLPVIDLYHLPYRLCYAQCREIMLVDYCHGIYTNWEDYHIHSDVAPNPRLDIAIIHLQ